MTVDCVLIPVIVALHWGALPSDTSAFSGERAGYDYNGRGDLIAQTDALRHVSQFAYDGTGNLTRQEDPDGAVTVYQYDAAGNRTAETSTRSQPGGGVELLVSTFEYDDAGRLTRQRNPLGEVVLTEYNELGKQSEVRTASGATQYEYDIRGEVSIGAGLVEVTPIDSRMDSYCRFICLLTGAALFGFASTETRR